MQADNIVVVNLWITQLHPMYIQ